MTTPVEEYLLIPPNWNVSVKYRRRWQTTLLTSLKGNEQRSSLLTWPRRTLLYSLLTNNFYELAYIKRKLHKGLHKIWGVPFWQDRAILTSPANKGENLLNVNSTRYRNFEVGASCILIKMVDCLPVCEMGIIGSLPGSYTQIVLTENLSLYDWAVGAEVYPLLKARLRSGQEFASRTSGMGSMDIEAAEEFDDGVARYVGDDSEYPKYPIDSNIPIFDKEPNWQIMNMSFIDPYDLLSFLGKSAFLSYYDEGGIGLSMDFLISGKSSIWKLLNFFDACKGRWGAFWLPTWLEDIIVTQPFSASDHQLTIKVMGYSEDWLGTKAGGYLTMLWPDGERVCKKIIDAPSSTTLTLDSAVGKACPAWQLRRLVASFMFLSRFAMDEIEFEYITDSIVKTTSSFQSVFAEQS